MFDNNFKEAEEYLRYAFEKCDRDSKVNKRLILIYLIPGILEFLKTFYRPCCIISQDVAGTDA